MCSALEQLAVLFPPFAGLPCTCQPEHVSMKGLAWGLQGVQCFQAALDPSRLARLATTQTSPRGIKL